MPERAVKPLNVDEFLDWDSGDDRRYELIDGVPVAMVSPTRAHRILSVNFARRLSEALDERPPCTVGAEEPIAIPGRNDRCHVADLAVTCRPHEPGQRLTPEPILVVEILAPSTESHDRRVKLPDYRAIDSIDSIILVDQEQCYCEVHRRLDQDRWLVDLLRNPEARLRLPGLGFEQPLSVLYANVSFPEADRLR